MLKRLYMLGMACLTAGAIWAQPKLTVSRDVANMGELMFKMPGKASFVVENTGTSELLITQINPSCGCTTVEWTQTPIAPGETGTIEVEYDAMMLGTFQKDLEVYSNASDEPVYLHVQGRVVSKLSNYEGLFPVSMGNLRLNTNNVEFDNVNKGDQPMVEIAIVNTARTSYVPQLMHLPPYLHAKYLPEKLSGGRIGKIQLTLDSERLKQMGLHQTSIYLARKIGDQIGEDNEIVVSVVLLPDFSQLNKLELERAPKMLLSTDSLDLGDLGRKNKKTGIITIENKGKSPLEIRTIQVFNKAVGISLGNRTIAAGEKTKLKITIQGKYLAKAKNKPRVLLITNDPEQPKVVIPVTVQTSTQK